MSLSVAIRFVRFTLHKDALGILMSSNIRISDMLGTYFFLLLFYFGRLFRLFFARQFCQCVRVVDICITCDQCELPVFATTFRLQEVATMLAKCVFYTSYYLTRWCTFK